MHANKRLVIIGSFLLAAVWAAWCIYFLPKGLDFTDEGLYCSEAWRLPRVTFQFAIHCLAQGCHSGGYHGCFIFAPSAASWDCALCGPS